MKCAVHSDVDATGYCRNCGKAMCAECSRPVRDVLYCEDCLATVMGHAAPAATPAPPPAYAPPPAAGFPPATPYATAPVAVAPRGVTQSSPGAAFLLGLVPGLGAIYNASIQQGSDSTSQFSRRSLPAFQRSRRRPYRHARHFSGWFYFLLCLRSDAHSSGEKHRRSSRRSARILERRPAHRSDHSYRPRWPLAPEQFSSLRIHSYRASMAFDSDRRGTVHVPGQA